MAIKNKEHPFFLAIGDLIILTISLILAIFVRNGGFPEEFVLVAHVLPFAIIFLFSITVFFIAGLYEKHTIKFDLTLPPLILNSQIANTVFAITFFYFVPFVVSPKTTLFIYIIFSTILLFFWRRAKGKLWKDRVRDVVIILGEKTESLEIENEFKSNPRFGIKVEKTVDLELSTQEQLKSVLIDALDKNFIVIVDTKNQKVIDLFEQDYNSFIFNHSILDIHKVYEDIFDRVPLQSLNYKWTADSFKKTLKIYDFLKRFIDILISLVLGILSLPFFVFGILLIKLFDNGSIFVTQERLGKHGKIIKLLKLRTMTTSDRGAWLPENTKNKVTKVGFFIRKTRIDELLPPLFYVLKGDLSLIGPRPDIIGLAEDLQKQIPFYMTRYLVSPGLSGFAQIKQDKPPQSLEETKLRLSYDLYYVKYRSLFLDLKIALRTIKTLLSRSGM